MPPAQLPTLSDVDTAARRLDGMVRRTPLRLSPALSAQIGGPVYLKCEHEQITGSFKIRGALNALSLLDDAHRRNGVVASSAGNHGLGIAWAARHLGIRATVFVPVDAPRVKREGIAALGATVDSSAAFYDEAHRLALDFARDSGATFVDPCSGIDLLSGQGTIALEILEELPGVRTVVLPVGGGGLLGGVGSVLRARAPGVRIVGAQSVRTAAMSRSIAKGSLVSVPVAPTLADGLAGDIDSAALEIGQYALDAIVEVEERDIARAIAWLWRDEGATVEGAGAVGVAAVRERIVSPLTPPIVVILTGGNIDPERHAALVRDTDSLTQSL